ncbi:class I SAM-dependent methyltransferase [Thermomonospora cellulosilytica]|uniref:SAM-dependent methyltransferase n=1 Tax=Thermomonospora cellulosilytica TaxID=1411118 RepID=A0A7W3MVK2_9ACTN|nr:class I SAM-dependent methyltransferase [Thermomonospora cellulosilytica]MBA9002712.1 SAM-dependent methyltransferase [Thermomonospora cellulosilytica]
MYETRRRADPARDMPDVTTVTCGTYDAMAEEYADATEDYAKFPGLRDEVVAFEKALPPGLPVLDLGCGGGRDSRMLADLGRRVVAGDYAPSMLRCARSRSAGRDGRLGFVRLNILDLPFADDRFAGTWASGSLLHLPSAKIPVALEEIRRTLAPGGMAAISMRAGTGEDWREGGTLAGRRWFTLVTPDGFADRMAQAGFRRVRVHDAGRRDWFVALGRK